jgi:uncharacterized membrane protein
MENKKLLKGAWPKNVVMGVSWLVPAFAVVAFILDYQTLDLDEKRTFVSIFITFAAAYVFAALSVLILPAIVAIAACVFSIIAAVKAFMGEDYKVPVAYALASKIIKD